jgi:hypothetical protein
VSSAVLEYNVPPTQVIRDDASSDQTEDTAKLLAKEVERQHHATLMSKEHVKDRQLDDSLIGTCPNTVQAVRQEPLRSPVNTALPYTCQTTDERGEEKHRSSAHFVGSADPPDIAESKQQVVQRTASIHVDQRNTSIFRHGGPGSAQGVLPKRERACV